MYTQSAKIIRQGGPVGRPGTDAKVKQQIIEHARMGHGRKDIAIETGVSVRTITRVLHAAGVYLPRGGDRSAAHRAAEREAPAGRHDRSLSVDLAAAWAPSAYQNGRLKRDLRGQRGLPSALTKKYDSEKGGFLKI